MEPELMTIMEDSEVSELSSGYKLVPWASWNQWNFVRESLFSSSPDSVAPALRRISAWRSRGRGCVPVPIDVTESIIKTQQKDPFFRSSSMTTDGEECDEESLAQLYSMAIMRLVNGFVEPAHKKTGRSISELADAFGIPRMLVDIRHESSHRNLPSLRLLRMASMKALDWLKCNYWEPQKNAIPDVKKEIRCKLHELTHYLKIRHTQKLRCSQIKAKGAKRSALLRGSNKLSSQIMGKFQSCKSGGSEKQISRISKVIARLYSAYPSEVVSVLLESFKFQSPDFSNNIDLEQYDKPNDEEPSSVGSSIYDLKATVSKLSSRRPRLLVSMLKTLLEMIEVKESKISERGEFYFLSSQYQGEICNIKNLSSLVPWLLMNLKALKDSGQVRLSDEHQVPSTDKNAAPIVSLTELLHKCLALSALGGKHLSNSVLLITEMIGNHSLSKKIKKLPLLHCEEQDFECISAFPQTESMLLEEEDFIKTAEKDVELLKSHLRSRKRNIENPTPSGMWTVAGSWIPCPIGMLPCSFSSTAVLPVLERVCDGSESREMKTDNGKVVVGCTSEMSEPSDIEDSLENASPLKKLKETPEDRLDLSVAGAPMEGRLLTGGVMKLVNEEELLSIVSNIRIFV